MDSISVNMRDLKTLGERRVVLEDMVVCVAKQLETLKTLAPFFGVSSVIKYKAISIFERDKAYSLFLERFNYCLDSFKFKGKFSQSDNLRKAYNSQGEIEKVVMSLAMYATVGTMYNDFRGLSWKTLFISDVFKSFTGVEGRSRIDRILNALQKDLGFEQIFIMFSNRDLMDSLDFCLGTPSSDKKPGRLQWV